MPEYLSPGVYIEEVSFRAKSIEGSHPMRRRASRC